MGDSVEAIDDLYGAWFEGKVVDIVKNLSTLDDDEKKENGSESKRQVFENITEDPSLQDDGLLYKVSFDL